MRVSIPKDTKCEIESDPEASKFEIDFSLPHAKRALCIIYNPQFEIDFSLPHAKRALCIIYNPRGAVVTNNMLLFGVIDTTSTTHIKHNIGIHKIAALISRPSFL